jgi:hypothetical protein
MNGRNGRLLLVAGGVIAAVVLFVVLRPGGDDEAGSTTPAATTAAPTQATATETTPDSTEATETAPPPPPEPTAFTVALAGGTVAGGIQRWSVTQGDRVRIVVRSDVDDELHLHGYDIEKQVGPGRPATFVFDATLAGRFELEAHHGGGQIAQLDVEP